MTDAATNLKSKNSITPVFYDGLGLGTRSLREYLKVAKREVDRAAPNSLATTDPALALARYVSLATIKTINLIGSSSNIIWERPFTRMYFSQFLAGFYCLRETLKKLSSLTGQLELWPKGGMTYLLKQAGPSVLHAGLALSKKCLTGLQESFPIGDSAEELLRTDQFDPRVIAWIEKTSNVVALLRPISTTTPEMLFDDLAKFQSGLQYEYDTIRPSITNLFKFDGGMDNKASRRWQIRFRGQEIAPIVTPMDGFKFVAYLIRYPDKQVSAQELELVSNPIPEASMIVKDGSSTSKKSGEPAYKGYVPSDNRADGETISDVLKNKSKVEEEINSLETRLAGSVQESEKVSLQETLAQKKESLKSFVEYLKDAKQPLVTPEAADSRRRISQAIKDARKKIIEAGCAPLAEHLKSNIKSESNHFSYRSDPATRWEFD